MCGRCWQWLPGLAARESFAERGSAVRRERAAPRREGGRLEVLDLGVAVRGAPGRLQGPGEGAVGGSAVKEEGEGGWGLTAAAARLVELYSSVLKSKTPFACVCFLSFL